MKIKIVVKGVKEIFDELAELIKFETSIKEDNWDRIDISYLLEPEIKKEMKMLTLQKLNEMKPGTIFAKGEAVDCETELHMARTGRKLRWLAKRGGINDWTIYCHFADKSFEWIEDYGDKVTGEQNIKRLVPCDDEAFKRYRL